MHRFKELNIWKAGRVFASNIYSQTQNFPNEEKFGLVNQLRRAAVSIPSNIAEGASRSSKKEFARYIEIAIGSAYEIDTQLLIAMDIGFFNKKAHQNLDDDLQSLIRQLSKFKSSLK